MVLLLPTTTSFHSHWSNPSKTRIMQTLVLNGFLDMGSKSCKISCCSRHNHIMSQHLTKSRIQPSFTKRWSSHLLDSLMAGPYATRLSVTNDPRLSGTTFSPVINRFSPFLSLFFFLPPQYPGHACIGGAVGAHSIARRSMGRPAPPSATCQLPRHRSGSYLISPASRGKKCEHGARSVSKKVKVAHSSTPAMFSSNMDPSRLCVLFFFFLNGAGCCSRREHFIVINHVYIHPLWNTQTACQQKKKSTTSAVEIHSFFFFMYI